MLKSVIKTAAIVLIPVVTPVVVIGTWLAVEEAKAKILLIKSEANKTK